MNNVIMLLQVIFRLAMRPVWRARIDARIDLAHGLCMK